MKNLPGHIKTKKGDQIQNVQTGKMFKINVKKEMQIAILKQMHVRNTCPIM
jgi:phosphoribosylformylglycinamidine (FGAM) synthase PurS component